MATIEEAPPRPPSAKVIAFAVSVVRSKPPELSVGEYIRLLRLHIAKGSRAGAVSSTYQHLDRSAYWRSESERMHSALKETQDELVDLQREVALLKAKLDVAKLANPSKKRKKNDDETIPYPRSPKKSKPNASSGRNGAFLTLDSSAEVEFGQAGEIGSALLRNLFHIQTLPKSHNKIDPAQLAYHIIRASSDMPQIVLDEVQKLVKGENQTSDGLEKVLLLARRAVILTIGAFNRLSQVPDESGSESKATFAIVHMFKAFLAGLAQLSESEAAKSLIADTAARRSAMERSKGKSKMPRILNIKENPTLSMYTTFLTSIIASLDAKKEGNQALFEGFGYCVLDSVGKVLYNSVFGHPRAETLEAEILQSNVSGDAEDGETSPPPPPPPPPQDEDRKQIRLEAPYLITLLKRVLAVAPLYLGAAMSARTGKPKQAHNRASMKGALAVEAKERLQRTLVTCMFGAGEGMSSDVFTECLKMPTDKGSISMPKVKEAEVQDWFKEEMWRLLGWEILRGDLFEGG